jgi:hypothetical protein
MDRKKADGQTEQNGSMEIPAAETPLSADTDGN